MWLTFTRCCRSFHLVAAGCKDGHLRIFKVSESEGWVNRLRLTNTISHISCAVPTSLRALWWRTVPNMAVSLLHWNYGAVLSSDADGGVVQARFGVFLGTLVEQCWRARETMVPCCSGSAALMANGYATPPFSPNPYVCTTV